VAHGPQLLGSCHLLLGAHDGIAQLPHAGLHRLQGAHLAVQLLLGVGGGLGAVGG
jgi:hypothetical protein